MRTGCEAGGIWDQSLRIERIPRTNAGANGPTVDIYYYMGDEETGKEVKLKSKLEVLRRCLGLGPRDDLPANCTPRLSRYSPSAKVHGRQICMWMPLCMGVGSGIFNTFDYA